MERKEGYYWVKYCAQWEVMFYSKKEDKWYQCAASFNIPFTYFEEIDPTPITRQ